MSIELFNDARMTLFSAMHTLTCIKTRIAHVLGDEEANDFSFAIEGVVMLLKKAEDEYEAAEIAERAAAREPEPTVVAVDHAPRAEVIDLFERLKQSIAKGEHPKGGAE